MRAALLLLVLACGCAEPLLPLPSGGVGLPGRELCDPVRTWSAEAIELEVELSERIAQAREDGADCGARGLFDPAPSLSRSGSLICAARLHSRDMAMREFVDHVDPDGVTAWDRVRATGYDIATADEVIAAGPLTADDVFDDAWIAREGSCAAILSDTYIDVGVGVYVDETAEHAHYFTLLLGDPPAR